MRTALLSRLFAYRRELAFASVIVSLEWLLAAIGTQDKEKCQLVNGALFFVMGLLAVGFWGLTPSQWRLPWMGLRITDRCFREIGWGILLACVYYLPAIGMPVSFNLIWVRTNPDGLQFAWPTWGPWWTAIMISIAAFWITLVEKVFGEELAFRGYLFGTVHMRSGLAFAVVSNCVVFTLWHVPYFIMFKTTAVGPLVLQSLWLAVGTVPICLLFAATKNVYAISAYHVLVNLKEGLFLNSNPASTFGRSAMFTFTTICPLSYAVCQIVALAAQVLFAWWLWRRLGPGPRKDATQCSNWGGDQLPERTACSLDNPL